MTQIIFGNVACLPVKTTAPMVPCRQTVTSLRFRQADVDVCAFSGRVTENESVNKMSLHNLATVFGPTLLRPSEKESRPSHGGQPIAMNDSWSLEVMAQVRPASTAEMSAASAEGLTPVSVSTGPGSSLLPPAGEHSNPRQQTSEPPVFHRSLATQTRWLACEHWLLRAAEAAGRLFDQQGNHNVSAGQLPAVANIS